MNFSYILGHKNNIEHLNRLIENKRLGHALLFSGAAGIGKRMVAAAFAARLNCRMPKTDGACGVCPSCLRLKAGTHPHIKFIGIPKEEKVMEVNFSSELSVAVANIVPYDEESSRKKMTSKINIDQIREVIKESSLKSYDNHKKIFIIDDVAVSTKEALNCLLKILEEPPAETYFILVTSKEEQLLPTIISRCQKIDFASLSDEDMEEYTRENLEEGFNEERIKELIGISCGSPGRLLAFAQIEGIDLAEVPVDIFFENVRNWFADTAECIEKLKILLELEGVRFRRTPTDEAYSRIQVISETLENVKRNINPELAVSNMFIKMGAVDFGNRV